jgi:hypothetical protein
MDIVIWLMAVIALVIGLAGYSGRKWWQGRGHGSSEWWQANRRRKGWWW